MALRIVILVCSLFLPAAKSASGIAANLDELPLISRQTSEATQAERQTHPVVAAEDDRSWSSPCLPRVEEDNDEDEFLTHLSAICQEEQLNLATSLSVAARPCPLTAHYTSWCSSPLRC